MRVLRRKELLERIDSLEKDCKLADARIAEMKGDLEKALGGGRCSGNHCVICANHTKDYKRGLFGALEPTIGCMLDMAHRCKDFKPFDPPDDG